jgi:hypothetical protein
LVGWIEYVVCDEVDGDERFAKEAWQKALASIKEGVRDAARERGLGNVRFD